MEATLAAGSGGLGAPGATLVSAVVAAVVALAVGLITQWFAQRREAASRGYERRRQAALDLQQAALTLRARLREYGRTARQTQGLPSLQLAAAEDALDDALSSFDVTLTRIEDPAVGPLAHRWVSDAQQRYVSTRDVGVPQEQASWDTMHAALGDILQSPTGAPRR